MSFNNLLYDDCAFGRRLQDNKSVLDYTLNSNKFYNCNERRVDFGLLGGNNVSQSTENLVDLESDLRNQTRLTSLCPSRKYQPKCNKATCGRKQGLPCGSCQSRMHHLPSSQLVDYRPRYNNRGFDLKNVGCPGNPTMFAYAGSK
jgi:hypothetical protein